MQGSRVCDGYVQLFAVIKLVTSACSIAGVERAVYYVAAKVINVVVDDIAAALEVAEERRK